MSQNFGPDNGSLKIRTRRTGGAAKAGHDLVIEVESWQATLDPEAQPALTLIADSRTLRVLDEDVFEATPAVVSRRLMLLPASLPSSASSRSRQPAFAPCVV